MANNNRCRDHYKARLKRRRREAERFIARCQAVNSSEAAKGLPTTNFAPEIQAFTEYRLKRDV